MKERQVLYAARRAAKQFPIPPGCRLVGPGKKTDGDQYPSFLLLLPVTLWGEELGWWEVEVCVTELMVVAANESAWRLFVAIHNELLSAAYRIRTGAGEWNVYPTLKLTE